MFAPIPLQLLLALQQCCCFRLVQLAVCWFENILRVPMLLFGSIIGCHRSHMTPMAAEAAAAEEPAAAGSAAVGKQVDNSAAPPGLLFRTFYRVNPNGTLDCVKNLSLECNRQRS